MDVAPIKIVIDISHESPVYDPAGLEQAGIQYHKFPTVSKLPPTGDEVRAFISLVDSLLPTLNIGMDNHASAEGNRGAGGGGESAATAEKAVIAVHCHYGFNRTGYFIVSYLVERKGYTLQFALDLFATKRPPGIRHEHFVDELFVRYCSSS